MVSPRGGGNREAAQKRREKIDRASLTDRPRRGSPDSAGHKVTVCRQPTRQETERSSHGGRGDGMPAEQPALAEGALPPAPTEARAASAPSHQGAIIQDRMAVPRELAAPMTPPRWSRDQSSRATPRKAHRPPWACRESFRKLAVRRVAASPESIGGEGEELVPNAALLHNDTMCVFPAVPETGKRRKVGRPAGALPGRQDWPHRREKDGCPAGAPPGWCGRGGETRRRG